MAAGILLLVGIGVAAFALRGTSAAKKNGRGRSLAVKADGVLSRDQLASNNDLANTLYRQVWPNCPPKLDPDNPGHQDCIEKWIRAADAIEGARARAKDPTERPSNIIDLGELSTSLEQWEMLEVELRQRGEPYVAVVESQVPSMSSWVTLVRFARESPDLQFVFSSANAMKQMAGWLGEPLPPRGYVVGATHGDPDVAAYTLHVLAVSDVSDALSEAVGIVG